MNICSLRNQELNNFIKLYIIVTAILLYITPFTQPEANILYSNGLFITDIVAKSFDAIFHIHWFIRLPFYLISLLNILLIKKVASIYIKDNTYVNLAVFLYLITPGVFVSFILVNYATIAIFLSLTFIYSYYNKSLLLEIMVFVLLIFTNTASWVFYLAIAIFAYTKKDKRLTALSVMFLIIAIIVGAYPIDGVPKGHFMQVLGIYGATLSPFYFLAFIYAIYRLGISGQRSLLWYITTTFFILSLLLSIRQKIRVTDFTPFIVIASILVVIVYKNSISIRLKVFHKNYKRVCQIVVAVLLLETSIAALSYPLYLVFKDNFTIIDTSMYKIAEHSNIKCLKTINKRDKKLYYYYGIKECR